MKSNFYRRINGRGSSILMCSNCGVSFKRPNAHIRGDAHMCSRKCQREWRRKQKGKNVTLIKRICQQCGNEFSRRMGVGGKLMFCSRKCAHANRRINPPKIRKIKSSFARPKRQRTVAERNAIFNRKKMVGNKCEKCGSTEKLQGHHVLPYSEFPLFRDAIENIQILCAKCHAKEHPKWANMITFPKIRNRFEITCIECGKIRGDISKSSMKHAKYCSHKCQLESLHRLTSQRWKNKKFNRVGDKIS